LKFDVNCFKNVLTKKLTRKKVSNSDKEKKDGGESVYGSKESSEEEGRGKEKEEVTARTKLESPASQRGFFIYGNPA